MKNVLISILLLTAVATARAQSPGTAQTDPPSAAPVVTAPAIAAPAPAPVPDIRQSAAPASDHSIIYVGTNDFYLALVREGIRTA